MAATQARQTNRYLSAPNPSGLADVVDLILDKGLVIDVYVRVSLVGIELLTIDARIVIASVDTYLRFAEAVGRMDLAQSGDAKGLPDLMESATSGASKSKAKGALNAAKDEFAEIFRGDDEEDQDDDEDGRERRERRREPVKRRRREREGEGDDA
jgi:hypothetical protein